MTIINNIRQLLSKISDGNTLAFNTLYEEYYKVLCAYAFNLIGNADVTNDIVQNVFIKVWENRKKIDEINNLESYLFSSVKNQCLDHIKHIGIKDKYRSYILSLTVDNFSQELKDETDELAALIHEKISQLSPSCKKVFENKMLGHSNKEIAQVLDISIKTVEWHITNAKKEIKTVVESYRAL